MECPKCGRAVQAGAFICPGCEFILDTSFLGDDITDDDHEKRLALKEERRNSDFGEDAIILGDGQGEYSGFSTRDAGMTREVTQARFYIGGATAAILHPDAVPEWAPNVVESSLKMSPFEQHVLGFINGKRSIARIQKKSGMEDSEFKTSVAMLADKGIIRLRTTKKKKKTPTEVGGSLPSRSESSRVSPAPDGPVSDRTVVANFQLPDAPPGDRRKEPQSAIAAAAALDDDERPKRAEVRGSRTTSAAEATIIKGTEPPKSRLPGFASVRLQEKRDEEQAERAEEDERADAWGEGEKNNNISNVFARAQQSQLKRKGPSLADELPLVSAAEAEPDAPMEEPEEFVQPGGDDDFFEKNPTGPRKSLRSTSPGPEDDLAEALRDPTGMGDIAPVRDVAEDEGAVEDEDGNPDVVEEAAAADDDEDADDDRAPLFSDDEDGETNELPPRPALHDQATSMREPRSEDPTGPLPGRDRDASAQDDSEQQHDLSDADDEAEGFDVDLRTAAVKHITSAQTASLPNASVPNLQNLPSDALKPLPPVQQQQPIPPPAASASLAPPQALGLPGQSLNKPAPPPSLPGQALQQPGAGVPLARIPLTRVPATSAGPDNVPGGGLRGAAPGQGRPSAKSTVPFEIARKAEKIFEQALKDHAAGRISSARMNAKLAAMYDTSVDTYRDFLAALDSQGADAKPPGGGKSRELILFEQASECEGKGDFDGAVELLEQAVSINPKAAALRNRLGVVLSIRLKRHVEAMEQLKIAIELEPGNIVYMNNYSKVTALLDSQLAKDPEEKKKSKKINERVEIKKMRPKMF